MNAGPSNNPLSYFQPLFEPQAVAVVGASATAVNAGNRFIDSLIKSGFSGDIYPVHPKADLINGIPAYSSITQVPGQVDYSFVTVKASQVIPFLKEARGKVKFAQIMSSGFGESSHGLALEQELIEVARESGVRVIGPNCIGMHSPRGKLALIDGMMQTGGSIGFLSQSGGLSIDVLRRGKSLGLNFSGVVSLGNCADLGPNDLLEFFLADPNTKVIGMYLEHVRRGRHLFEQLKAANAKKPVIILKGGKTKQGQRAAASHTGFLVDDNRLWSAVIRQTGAIPADDLEALMNYFIAFQATDPSACVRAENIILFGNGGGTSVIATDQFAHHGLDVAPLDEGLAATLGNLKLPDGASIANPIDVPANILMRDKGVTACKIIDVIRNEDTAAALVVHLNLPVIAGYNQNDVITNLIEGTIKAQNSGSMLPPLYLVLRSDGDPITESLKTQFRQQAMNIGIPVFDELKDAAQVLAAHNRFMSFRSQRASLPI